MRALSVATAHESGTHARVHVAEDAAPRSSNPVRPAPVARTEELPDEHTVEASRLTDAALAMAGASKADLARALGRSEKWARNLADERRVETISLGRIMQLKRTAPRIFEAVRAALADVDAPPVPRAPTLDAQRRVVAVAMARLMLDESPASVMQVRRALDGLAALMGAS